MPRLLRRQCTDEFNHIYLRGVEKKTLFHDDQDHHTFLLILDEVFPKYGIKVHVYCLMSNHYHFLLQADVDTISDAMRDVNSKYARYYNGKYQRVGHLFEGRFKSKPIYTQDYYETLFRYIMLNPVVANMVKSLPQWQWSSYRTLIGLEEPRAFQEVQGIYQRMGEDIDIAKYLDEYSSLDEYDLDVIEERYKYDKYAELREYIFENPEILQEEIEVIIVYLKDELGFKTIELQEFLKLDMNRRAISKSYNRLKSDHGNTLTQSKLYQKLLKFKLFIV